jgi:hypothetical protein
MGQQSVVAPIAVVRLDRLPLRPCLRTGDNIGSEEDVENKKDNEFCILFGLHYRRWPYGLSIAAHLKSLAVDFRIFGSPMHCWRQECRRRNGNRGMARHPAWIMQLPGLLRSYSADLSDLSIFQGRDVTVIGARR